MIYARGRYILCIPCTLMESLRSHKPPFDACRLHALSLSFAPRRGRPGPPVDAGRRACGRHGRTVYSLRQRAPRHSQVRPQTCAAIPLISSALLRGAIVIRTHDVPKNPYVPLFLLTILGPDYYVPP